MFYCGGCGNVTETNKKCPVCFNTELRQIAGKGWRDSGQYIDIVDKVIAKMNIPYAVRDEAKSEGLLQLVIAHRKYDPWRGVPIEAYLAQSLRYALMNWRQRETKQPQTYDGVDEALLARADERYEDVVELLLVLEYVLQDETERMVFYGWLLGYPVAAICRIARINARQWKTILTETQTRLRNEAIKIGS